METAARILYLAHEIWLYRILAVGNKISQPEEEGLIREGLPDDIPLLSVLPYLEELRATGLRYRIARAQSFVLVAVTAHALNLPGSSQCVILLFRI
ncbi:hypothetical protein KAV67_04990 [Candidatus Bipolaricaulota bacterium]|nr:hypothetical protein [Candidatus Bipolaricaulota bacterium]